MPAAYDAAVEELARAPLARFVAERKRLAAALRARHEPELAARLEKRRKPPIAAWAVNQLWWQARDAFDRMLGTAARLREGELGAARAHHDATGALRARAGEILRGAGLGASDATLRRVTTTLAALAASGGFAPDPPGALEDDREAPGFAALDGAIPPRAARALPDDAASRPRARAADAVGTPGTRAAATPASRRVSAQERAAARRRAAAERQRRQQEQRAERARERAQRAKLHRERTRLERALDAAIRDERAREHAVAELEGKAAAARRALDEARQRSRVAQRALASLDPPGRDSGARR